MSTSEMLSTYESVFFLQGGAKPSTIFILSLLRDIVEHEAMMVEMKATLEIAAALSKRERTLHSLIV